MSLLWDVYWPVLTVSIIIGLITGVAAFREEPANTPAHRRKLVAVLAAGIVLTLAFGAVWHGPVGSGRRVATSIEKQSRQVLIDWEMPGIQAHLERDPLRRTLDLSGAADDFQRGELVRIMSAIPGVARARWTDQPKAAALPLIAEVELAALVSFGLGLLLSYLLELRRRYRAHWRW
jgi:hypothetical protein